jgi:hypothetical protein
MLREDFAMARLGIWIAAALAMIAAPVGAQTVKTVDPDSAIDADLNKKPQTAIPAQPADEAVDPGTDPATGAPYAAPEGAVDAAPSPAPRQAGAPDAAATAGGLTKPEAPATFDKVRLISAAEGVFGRGASGLAGLIEDILKDQGEPNAYIAGSEGSGALVLGLRYGSGDMVHAVEGERRVFWTGPSVGFDVGGDANKVFVLVYNLYDSQELYKRFPAGEGRVYFVGGFSATYLRRGDVVLIPVRLGVGWRAGVNVGYMKFSEKSRWFPF